MLKYSDIIEVIYRKLSEGFPSVFIESGNIKEGIKRPSFFVEFDGIQAENFMQVGIDRKIRVYLYYFPSDKDKNQMELLEVRSELENLFMYDAEIQVNDYNIPIDALFIDTTDNAGQDKILTCNFTLELYECWDKPEEHEKMGRLVYEVKS